MNSVLMAQPINPANIKIVTQFSAIKTSYRDLVFNMPYLGFCRGFRVLSFSFVGLFSRPLKFEA